MRGGRREIRACCEQEVIPQALEIRGRNSPPAPKSIIVQIFLPEEATFIATKEIPLKEQPGAGTRVGREEFG